MLIDIDIIIRVFIKKSIDQMSINRRRAITTQGAHASLATYLLSLLSLLMKSFEEEIQLSKDLCGYY